jgi:hypothetical protein
MKLEEMFLLHFCLSVSGSVIPYSLKAVNASIRHLNRNILPPAGPVLIAEYSCAGSPHASTIVSLGRTTGAPWREHQFWHRVNANLLLRQTTPRDRQFLSVTFTSQNY